MTNSIVVVDDHELAHTALRLLVSSRTDLNIRECFRRGRNALKHLQGFPADVIILDLELPDLPGLNVLETVVERGLGPVLILSGVSKPAIFRRCQTLGAMGIVSKGDPADETLAAIDSILDGCEYLSPSITNWLEAYRRGKIPVGLSGRQTQILDLVAEGLTNKEISYRLEISQPTVSFHLNELLKKLGADHPRQLVELAKAEGLI